ncbi:tubulin folding cofactor A [Medicago truncatula]|uniref:Tubulin-specific chaperone A n=2 Tax=Medicago truncatula TaxID=3880 RepID=G7K4C5_MEDTR|nr:tubulin folding cofactor A [Medicago truncatula]
MTFSFTSEPLLASVPFPWQVNHEVELKSSFQLLAYRQLFDCNFQNSYVEFNRRQANGVAHELARVAPSHASSHVYDDVPSCIRDLIISPKSFLSFPTIVGDAKDPINYKPVCKNTRVPKVKSKTAASEIESLRSFRDFLLCSSHSNFNIPVFPISNSMDTVRSLKIKTSTCKRLVKELHSYEKEVEREAAKTADMKNKGADPYDLKQQENVLGESRMMIPDCRKRLEAALEDLKGILAELLNETDKKESPEIDEARNTIVEVEKVFETIEA